MIYGYIRVSTDRQTVENQRFEITRFAETEGLEVDGWIEETISGTKAVNKRKLGELLETIEEGDLIICSELSRLGRSLFMIMDILNQCMEQGVRVWTVKEGYRLGDDIQSKVLAFAFGLSAEIERNLISQRTKEALARRRQEGVTLGRPVGRRSAVVKLSGYEQDIRAMLDAGITKAEIARRYHVHRATVGRFIETRMADSDAAIDTGTNRTTDAGARPDVGGAM
ncbi:master DNA invertase Mpi family serine-type recombinase [Bifidobacterium samirii]|uniref:Invertase n=1 Tax=Bifidobacterium samirii TaxID=2306974 RepID=A0A430FWZ7_9BIFI|nr:master DNA invertase Mpi family serine-type recombinase [Bifidobacterium samirii]RSX58806.1 invertase [Bifidobacterium samirii]